MSHSAALQCCYHFCIVQSKPMKFAIKVMSDEMNQSLPGYAEGSHALRILNGSQGVAFKVKFQIIQFLLSFEKTQILVGMPQCGPFLNLNYIYCLL